MFLIWTMTFIRSLNKQMIHVEAVSDKYEIGELKQMIMDHVNYTNSESGKRNPG